MKTFEELTTDIRQNFEQKQLVVAEKYIQRIENALSERLLDIEIQERKSTGVARPFALRELDVTSIFSELEREDEFISNTVKVKLGSAGFSVKKVREELIVSGSRSMSNETGQVDFTYILIYGK